MLPLAEMVKPRAIITVPKMTVKRMLVRSATQPIRMPPAPVPSHVKAPASATTWRAVPRSSVIGFRPTTTRSGEP